MCSNFFVTIGFAEFITSSKLLKNSLEKVVWDFLNVRSCHLQVERIHFFLPHLDAFYYYCLISPGRASSIMLNSTGESGDLCLVP